MTGEEAFNGTVPYAAYSDAAMADTGRLAGNRMLIIPLLTGELIFTGIWLLARIIIWVREKRICWKREAMLLLLYINLAVLIRFVFYPFFRAEGHVRPLQIDLNNILPFRINLIPFVNIMDYDVKREAVINIVGNTVMFIPTGIILPILYKELNSFGKVICAGAGISLLIEMLQLLLPGSVTDIDDLILNTLGVCIGFAIYCITRCFRRKKCMGQGVSHP